MTTPQSGQASAGQVPLDANNPILSEVQAMLATALVPTPGGQRLVLTLRTGSTTMTVFLAKDDAQRWRDQLSGEISRMTGLILPPGQ